MLKIIKKKLTRKAIAMIQELADSIKTVTNEDGTVTEPDPKRKKQYEDFYAVSSQTKIVMTICLTSSFFCRNITQMSNLVLLRIHKTDIVCQDYWDITHPKVQTKPQLWTNTSAEWSRDKKVRCSKFRTWHPKKKKKKNEILVLVFLNKNANFSFRRYLLHCRTISRTRWEISTSREFGQQRIWSHVMYRPNWRICLNTPWEVRWQVQFDSFVLIFYFIFIFIFGNGMPHIRFEIQIKREKRKDLLPSHMLDPTCFVVELLECTKLTWSLLLLLH